MTALLVLLVIGVWLIVALLVMIALALGSIKENVEMIETSPERLAWYQSSKNSS